MFSAVSLAPPFAFRTRASSDNFSANCEVLSQARFARLLVLCAHVLTCIGEGFDRRVEVNTMTRSDFVRRDHVSGPSLDRAEGATLDTGNLYVAGDGVARHTEVMLDCRFGGVLESLGIAPGQIRKQIPPARQAKPFCTAPGSYLITNFFF